jgi:glycosyltransferase involved in cell wall biosynthesis
MAVVCPRFSEKATVGGAETLLKNLAERLAAAGVRVSILTTCAEDHFTWANSRPPGHRRIGDLDVHFFPVDEDRDVARFLDVQNEISRDVPVTDAQERAWIDNSVNSRALYHHLSREGAAYDAVLAGPYLFGLTYHACRVHPEKTFLVPCLHDEPFARVRLFRDLFHQVAGCLFNAEPERELAAGLYQLPAEACHVVGMGLDPFDADPHAFARRRGLGQPYLLYAGRREQMKGTPLLADYVRAFRERTEVDIRLVMTGSGTIEAPSELLPYILDLGFVSEEEKREALAGALAFCHPSAYESFGIVVLESWLAGRPCLVSAHGKVLPYHCRASGGGLWFRSYPEFEEELNLLLHDPDLATAMGAAGRAYVTRDYAWPRVMERLEAALQSLAR